MTETISQENLVSIDIFLSPIDEDECTASCIIEFLAEKVFDSFSDSGTIDAVIFRGLEDDGEDLEVAQLTVQKNFSTYHCSYGYSTPEALNSWLHVGLSLNNIKRFGRSSSKSW